MINYKYIDGAHRTDYLMHHGVKGMKWGVRNEDTKRRYFQLTKKGKDREHTKDVIIKNKIKENRKNKIKGFDQNRSSYQLTTGVNDNPHLSRSKGVIIPKGSRLARVGSYERERDTTKPTYYSIIKNDRNTYLATNRAKAIASKAGVKKLNRWGGTYEYSPIVKEDIIAPSKKEARKILGESIQEAYKTNVERDTFNYRSNMRHENFIKRYGTNKSIDRAIKTGVANDRLLKSISNVMGVGTTKEIKDSQKALGKKAKTLGDIFKKNLQQKGYNAVKDYNDAYNPTMASRSPLIILNKKKTVGNPKGKNIFKVK